MIPAYAEAIRQEAREGKQSRVRLGWKTCMNCGEPRRDVVDGWCGSCGQPEKPAGPVGVLDQPAAISLEHLKAWEEELRSYEECPPCSPREAREILRRLGR